MVAHVTTPAQPLRYHRLGTLTPPWWRPLVTVAIAVALYAGLVLVWAIALVLAGMANPVVAGSLEHFLAGPEPDLSDPVIAASMLAMLALMLPACRWAVALTGRRGLLDSVAGRFRWGLFVRGLTLALPVVGVTLLASHVRQPTVPSISPTSWTMLLVAVLLVPGQAAAEEYAFRGLLPQMVGSWLRSPVWGAVAGVPMFVVGHDYGAPGLTAVAGFALAATWVVWRTGGLELVVGWHIVNNLAGFAVESFGLADPNATASWVAALIDVAGSVLFVAGLEALWRRHWSGRYAATRASARPGELLRGPASQ